MSKDYRFKEESLWGNR